MSKRAARKLLNDLAVIGTRRLEAERGNTGQGKFMSEILELLKNGPVLVRSLRNRRAAFRLEYARLLRDGKIIECGSGTKLDPKYVGLPDAVFPDRRVTIQLADVCLLMLAGASEEEARERLKTAIAAGGEEEVIAVCEEANDYLVNQGLSPVREVPKAVSRY